MKGFQSKKSIQSVQSKNQQYRRLMHKSSIVTQFSTNCILKDYQKKKIFLPGYFRLKFKNFNDLDIGSLSAQLNASIILTIYYGHLIEDDMPKQDPQDQDDILKVLKNQIVLLFARDDAILLSDKQSQIDITIDHDHIKKQIKFSIRKIFHLYLDSEIFWSPFQIIHAMMEVTIQPVEIRLPVVGANKQETQKWTVQFNLMDNGDMNSKLSFTNWGTFGNYDLAEKKMGAFFTNYRVAEAQQFFKTEDQRIQQRHHRKTQRSATVLMERTFLLAGVAEDILKPHIQDKKHHDRHDHHETKPLHQHFKKLKKDQQSKQQKFQAFHYAHFNIPLYKFPFSALATIFMPLWLLAILNLGIFFQDNSLADRIAAVSAIMLALGALIPTIRSQIPPSPHIVFIQILVYSQSITTLLALLHSLDVRLLDNFQLIWYKSGFFLASALVTIITFVIIVIMLIIHYTLWQPSYNLISSRRDKSKFQRKNWRSRQCDNYFSDLFNYQIEDNTFFIRIIDKKSKNNNKGKEKSKIHDKIHQEKTPEGKKMNFIQSLMNSAQPLKIEPIKIQTENQQFKQTFQ